MFKYLKSPVYLAGGMHRNWRQRLVNSRPDLTFIDPTTHGLTDEREYTDWDLSAIDGAATLVAYMDAENPSGYGLCLEVGYAHALGKFIVFIDETDDSRRRYFGMVRACAADIFSSMDQAIAAMSDKRTEDRGEK